jgi:hypothetical protein
MGTRCNFADAGEQGAAGRGRIATRRKLTPRPQGSHHAALCLIANHTPTVRNLDSSSSRQPCATKPGTCHVVLIKISDPPPRWVCLVEPTDVPNLSACPRPFDSFSANLSFFTQAWIFVSKLCICNELMNAVHSPTSKERPVNLLGLMAFREIESGISHFCRYTKCPESFAQNNGFSRRRPVELDRAYWRQRDCARSSGRPRKKHDSFWMGFRAASNKQRRQAGGKAGSPLSLPCIRGSFLKAPVWWAVVLFTFGPGIGAASAVGQKHETSRGMLVATNVICSA